MNNVNIQQHQNKNREKKTQTFSEKIIELKRA